MSSLKRPDYNIKFWRYKKLIFFYKNFLILNFFFTVKNKMVTPFINKWLDHSMQ